MGGVSPVALVLGLWSITTAPVPFLGVWLLAQTLECAGAGAIIGACRGAARRKGLVIGVLVYVAACLALVVTLQSLGVVA